jgi:hypothetical protein
MDAKVWGYDDLKIVEDCSFGLEHKRAKDWYTRLN